MHPTFRYRPVAAALLAVSAAACGGTTQFRDNAAISITAPPPAPPPAPAPKKEEKPKPEPHVKVTAKKIEIDQKIQFAHDDSKILEASFPLLNEIADVIIKNPQITKILIGGHASSDGDDKHNLELSDKRANSVRDYLINKGVKADVLEAKGFGETQPLDKADTDAAREKNRRVEFTIEKQGRSLGAKESK
jgi:outer membrane protein OmpA-like peptidoglycan-associated protein